MSFYIRAYACTDNTSKEFERHLKSLKFCIENKLSLPKETSEFFQDAYEDGICNYKLDSILEEVQNGFKTLLGHDQQYFEIDIKDIPSETKKIIVEMS